MPVDETSLGLSSAGPRAAPKGGVVWTMVVVGLMASALLWRLPIAAPEWRYTLCENDSLYQLQRVQDCLRQYPQVPSIDRFSHFPTGYRVHWLAPHSFFYATIAKLAGIDADQRDRLLSVLSWSPPLFGLLAVALSMAIARCFTDDQWCVATIGLLCAFSADVCRPFFFGTIDHHLFAHVGTLLCVWARLRQRPAVWLLGLIALSGMTPEAILYVSLLLVCLFASEAAAVVCGHGPRRIGGFWFLSPSIVAMCVLVVQRLLETAPLPWSDLSWTYTTLFQPLWLAAFGGSALGALIGLAHALRAHRASIRVTLSVVAALGMVAAVCGAVLYWVGAFATIVGRLLVNNRIFVGEELSVFHAGFWATPTWYRLLALSGIFVVLKLWAAARRRAAAAEWFRWIVLAAAFTFGFKEYRHLYVLSSLQLIGLGVAAFETVGALQRLRIFSGKGTRWLPAGAMALALAPVFYRADLADRAMVHGDACAGMPLITELTEWLRTGTPNPVPDDGGVPTYGIFTPWSIGHHIHVLADRPVIVDPLNYDVGAVEEQTLERVWQSHSADELADALRAQQARYLVLTNPAEEIVGTLRRYGVAPEQFATVDDGGATVLRPAMNQFASFRLFMTSGLSAEFSQLQPRFFSAATEGYTVGGEGGESQRINVPRGQVYELKRGAVLTGSAGSVSEAATVSYIIRLHGGRPTEVHIPLIVNSDRQFEFHTALPAPVEEDSFRVVGGYHISAGERHVEVIVTQAMVDTHAAVAIQWPAVMPTAATP